MSKPKRTHIASSTPTRTRIKVSDKRRNPQEMGRLVEALESHPGIHDVRTNLQTGSIVIHHKPEVDSFDDIANILQDLGVILGHVAGLEIPNFEAPKMEGKSAVANDLTGAIADLNNRVGAATNGIVDLRILIPVGLGALAVRQLLKQGFQIEAAPWYVLAYYAFDSFIKLHYTHDPAEKEKA